jgi:lysophospholipid acyltransferase (LPLAT)-like uncharacterized protein
MLLPILGQSPLIPYRRPGFAGWPAKIERVTRDDSPRFSFGQRLVLGIVPRIVWALTWLNGLTWRFEVIAEDGVTPVLFGQKPGPEIYCFWHQCVLPCTIYFRLSRAIILISRSFDGELITRILRMFGFDAVRGSSSRSGREGLLGLKHVIETGRTAIFTADGPRGPIYQTKMGPIKLGQMTGAPIGAFHLEPERAWVMGSWDRFLVPKPFTRICVSWAQWTHVPHDLPAEEFEPKRQQLNDALERARRRALAHFGRAEA